MIALNFLAIAAVLRGALADVVTTSLLLPSGLFTNQPFKKPAFVGQVTVTRNTTYYTVDCYAAGIATCFNPGQDQCYDSSYTFSENSASTQYLLDE